MQTTVIPKLAWRLKELVAATGLSLPFWRKMTQLNKVKWRKVQGAVLIMDEDLREFLQGRKKGDENESPTTNQ